MSTKRRLSPSQAEILSVIKRRPKTGFTRSELADVCKKRSGSVCARVKELLDRCLIYVDGKRLDPNTKIHVEVLKPGDI